MASQSKKVYLSTDVMIAFIDRANTKHDQATAFFRYFALEGYQLYTDSIAMYDAYRKIVNDISPSIAKDFLRTLSMSSITILYPDDSDFKSALKFYLNEKSGDLTLQKAVMAVLADRRGIGQIATFEYMHAVFGLNIFYIPI